MNGARLIAWSVHAYTASGAVAGLLALDAIARGRHGQAFLWMAVATLIDATDGALARAARVKDLLPHFDGARLDDIIDYVNYVLVPVVLAYAAGLLPTGHSRLVVAAMPLLASAYGFCQVDAKTSDHFFKGFPSYWNVVVFYLYCLRGPIWFNAAALLFLSAMVFVPIRYLYPSRMPTARKRTYLLGAIWAVFVALILRQFPTPDRSLVFASLFFPVYYLAMSLHRHFATAPSPPLVRAAHPGPTGTEHRLKHH